MRKLDKWTLFLHLLVQMTHFLLVVRPKRSAISATIGEGVGLKGVGLRGGVPKMSFNIPILILTEQLN